MKEIVEFRSYKLNCADPMPSLYIESLPTFEYVEIQIKYIRYVIEANAQDYHFLNIPGLFNIYMGVAYYGNDNIIKLNKNQIQSKIYNNITFIRPLPVGAITDGYLIFNMTFYK